MACYEVLFFERVFHKTSRYNQGKIVINSCKIIKQQYKRLVAVILFVMCTIVAQAQYYMNVFHKDGNVTQTPVENIDSVNFNREEHHNQNREFESVNERIDSLISFINDHNNRLIKLERGLDSLICVNHSTYNPYSYNTDVTKTTPSSLSAGGSLQNTGFPQYLKANGVVTYSCKLLSFDKITVGFGTTTNSIRVKIDESKVYIVKSGSQSFGSFPHGLTI